MNRLAVIKLSIAAVGIVVFGYGVRVDDQHLRLAGMIVIAAAVALRLLPRSIQDRIDGRVPPGDTHS